MDAALQGDRAILDVAEHAEHVTFEKTSRKTKSGYLLPMIVHDRLSVSPEEFVRRYDLIQDAMATMDLDALLLRGPENITYVSGYESPGYYRYHCIVVPRRGEPVFVLRDFEWINVPEFAWSAKLAKVYDWDHGPDVTVNVLRQLGLGEAKRIGVEKRNFFYTVAEHETLGQGLPQTEFVDATKVLWNARIIKSEEEVAIMRRSAALVDMAMLAGYEATRPGATRRPDQRDRQQDAARERRRVYGAAALRSCGRAQLPAASDGRQQSAWRRRRDVFRDLGVEASLYGGADADDLPRPAEGRVAARGAGVHRRRHGCDGDHQAGRHAARRRHSGARGDHRGGMP